MWKIDFFESQELTSLKLFINPVIAKVRLQAVILLIVDKKFEFLSIILPLAVMLSTEFMSVFVPKWRSIPFVFISFIHMPFFTNHEHEWSVADCNDESFGLVEIDDIVMSSTHLALLISNSKSFINNSKSFGPAIVPSGVPAFDLSIVEFLLLIETNCFRSCKNQWPDSDMWRKFVVEQLF